MATSRRSMRVRAVTPAGFPLPPRGLVRAEAGLDPEAAVVDAQGLPGRGQIRQHHQALRRSRRPGRDDARVSPAGPLEELAASLPPSARGRDDAMEERLQGRLAPQVIAEAMRSLSRQPDPPSATHGPRPGPPALTSRSSSVPPGRSSAAPSVPDRSGSDAADARYARPAPCSPPLPTPRSPAAPSRSSSPPPGPWSAAPADAPCSAAPPDHAPPPRSAPRSPGTTQRRPTCATPISSCSSPGLSGFLGAADLPPPTRSVHSTKLSAYELLAGEESRRGLSWSQDAEAAARRGQRQLRPALGGRAGSDRAVQVVGATGSGEAALELGLETPAGRRPDGRPA